MQKRRASVVKAMTGGITALFKANGVTGIQGHGRLLPGNKVLVTGSNGAEKTLEAKHVVLASGSVPGCFCQYRVAAPDASPDHGVS